MCNKVCGLVCSSAKGMPCYCLLQCPLYSSGIKGKERLLKIMSVGIYYLLKIVRNLFLLFSLCLHTIYIEDYVQKHEYDMHSAWHTSVIKELPGCCWYQIVNIITVYCSLQQLHRHSQTAFAQIDLSVVVLMRMGLIGMGFSQSFPKRI